MNKDHGGITLRNNLETGENFAEVCVTGSWEEIANLAGTEFHGKELVVEEAERTTATPQQPLRTLADVAAGASKFSTSGLTSRLPDFLEYVIIDTTKYKDP